MNLAVLIQSSPLAFSNAINVFFKHFFSVSLLSPARLQYDASINLIVLFVAAPSLISI